MRNRLRSESGWAVVTAVILVAVMVGVGLAAMALVDNQNRQSGNQRQRESSLNLDEGAVYAQGFVLTQNWPYAGNAYPSSCSSSGIPTQWVNYCPNPNSLAAATSSNPALANFSSTDFLRNANWVTKVRDNGGPLSTYYDPANADAAQSGSDVNGKSYTCAGPCTWDANGDHRIWVEASAVVRGHPRAVVAQLQLELLTEDVPHAAVRAGSLTVSNNGNHSGTYMLDGLGTGGSTGTGGIWLRCNPAQASCASYQSGQVTPTPQQLPGAQQGPLMNNAELQRLKNTAIQNHTYYSGCPTPGGPDNVYNDSQYHLEGKVVWVENCPNPPQMSNKIYTVPCGPLPAGMSTNCVNSPTSPGVLVWHSGLMSLSGNVTYCGLLYAVNNSDGVQGESAINNADVIQMNGGFGVFGAIAVDGSGRLNAGSNGLQLTYSNIAFDAIQTYGTAGLVQNTWRELPPGS